MTRRLSWVELELAWCLLNMEGRFNAMFKRVMAGELDTDSRLEFAERLESLIGLLRASRSPTADPPEVPVASGPEVLVSREVIDELRTLQTILNLGFPILLDNVRDHDYLHETLAHVKNLLRQTLQSIGANIEHLNRHTPD